MKSSQILRRAKKRIESGIGTYLCYAIDCASDDDPDSLRKAEAMRSRIMVSIYPHTTAAKWLYLCIQPKQRYDVWAKVNEDALREWRARWLDALIAEYEAKGD